MYCFVLYITVAICTVQYIEAILKQCDTSFKKYMQVDSVVDGCGVAVLIYCDLTERITSFCNKKKTKKEEKKNITRAEFSTFPQTVF